MYLIMPVLVVKSVSVYRITGEKIALMHCGRWFVRKLLSWRHKTNY